MNEVRRGAGMGFGMVLGIVAAVVALPVIGVMLLCGGCAALVGTGAVVDQATGPAWREPAGQVAMEPTAPAEVAADVDDAIGSDNSDTEVGDTQEATPVDRSIKITMSEFRQLEDGMSYDQVYEIIGYHGEEVSSSDIAGIKTVMVAWQNDDGGNANAMFQNGELITRAQFGLPSGPSPLNVRRERKAVADAREAERLQIAREQEKQEQRRVNEARERANLAERDKIASVDLAEILASNRDLSKKEDIDESLRTLAEFADKHDFTDSADKARREAAALGALRVAYVFGETGKSIKYRLEELIEKYPGTLAAKEAAKLLPTTK